MSEDEIFGCCDLCYLLMALDEECLTSVFLLSFLFLRRYQLGEGEEIFPYLFSFPCSPLPTPSLDLNSH